MKIQNYQNRTMSKRNKSVRLTCCSFLHVVQLIVEERNLGIFLLYHIGYVV